MWIAHPGTALQEHSGELRPNSPLPWLSAQLTSWKLLLTKLQRMFACSYQAQSITGELTDHGVNKTKQDYSLQHPQFFYRTIFC